MRSLNIVLCLIASALLVSCDRPHDVVVIPIGIEFNLTAAQIDEFSRSALNGDAKSAVKLYMYYCVMHLDRAKYLYWLQIAALCNSPASQYNLGSEYLNSPDIKDREIAKVWLIRAKANGFQRAEAALTELGESCIQN